MKSQLSFLLFILFTLPAANSWAKPKPKPCSQINRLTYPSWTAKNLFNEMRKQKISSVDEALCLFPRELLRLGSSDFSIRTGMFGSPILITKSRSFQSSSALFPRVIIPPLLPLEITDLRAAPTDEFIPPSGELLFLSFNDSEFAGGDRLEILKVDPTQPGNHRIEMIDVHFDHSSIKEGPTVTRNTPVECQKCHGIEPRFLWARRNFWPSALDGMNISRSDDDEIKHRDSVDKTIYSLRGHPRYKRLRGYFGLHQNSLFNVNTVAASLANHAKVAQKMLETPDFEKYRYATAAALIKCRNLISYFPRSIYRFHQSRDFINKNNSISQLELEQRKLVLKDQDPTYETEIEVSKFKGTAFEPFLIDQAVIRKDLVHIGRRLKHFGKFDDFYDIQPHRLALRYIFEGRGIGISDWSSDVLEGTYSLSFFERNAKHSLLALIGKGDPEFYDSLNLGELSKPIEELDAGAVDAVCTNLKNKSLKALRDFKPTRVFDLSAFKSLSQKSQQVTHHFSNTPGGKLESNEQLEIDKRLPTTHYDKSVTKRSCNQCHFGYISNYTGPTFTRNKKANYPLEFMICANCHSDETHRVAPFIPFNHQDKFNSYVKENGKSNLLFRLSSKAGKSLRMMPPVLRLRPEQRENLRSYINNIEL